MSYRTKTFRRAKMYGRTKKVITDAPTETRILLDQGSGVAERTIIAPNPAIQASTPT